MFITEKFEDTKGVLRSRNSKNRQYNDQKKKDKKTSKILQRNLKIEQQETH